jgi:HAE1 family hydrophobic/amphiphilic exporter-1
VITSTLLTLLVIPTVYEILVDGRNWMLRQFKRLFGHKGQGPGGIHGGGEPRPVPQSPQD